MFGLLLGLCPFIIQLAFELAFNERGYYACGGEIITVTFPVLIIQWRLWTLNKIKEEKEKKKA